MCKKDKPDKTKGTTEFIFMLVIAKTLVYIKFEFYACTYLQFGVVLIFLHKILKFFTHFKSILPCTIR